MVLKKLILIFVSLSLMPEVSCLAAGEKKPLDEKAYGRWVYLQDEQISSDGEWVSYEHRNMDSLRRIVLHGPSALDTIWNGNGLVFSKDSKYAFYDIVPAGKGKGPSKRYLRNLETGDTVRYSSFLSMSFLGPSILLVQRKPHDTLAVKTWKDFIMKDVTLVSLETGDSVRFSNVVSQRFSDDGSRFVMSSVSDSSIEVSVYDIRKKEKRVLEDGGFTFTASAFGRENSRFALLERETEGKDTVFRIGVYEWKSLKKIAGLDVRSEQMPDGYGEIRLPLRFSHDGEKLYFKAGNKPVPSKDTSTVEGVDVSIWKWDAQYLPVNRRAAYQDPDELFCLLDIRKGKVTVLSGKEMPYFQFSEGEFENLTIGFDDREYRRSEDYEPGPRYDTYLVDLSTGDRKKVLEASYYIPVISYDKKYLAWFEPADSSWYVMNTSTFRRHNLTSGVDDIFYNDSMDMPMHAVNCGAASWLDSGAYLMVQAKNDVWIFDASGKEAPVCITRFTGRSGNIRFRYIKPEKSQRYIDSEKIMYFTAFGNRSKQSGYWSYDPVTGEFRKLVMGDCKYTSLVFSEDGGKCIWKRQTFTEYPELYISDADFSDPVRLSFSNPQQDEYLWGTSRLVEWESFNRDTLQGILCMPENLDTSRKYPMLVYFYEKKSDELHRYNIPYPISTVINWSYCVSNGYIVFVPDIVFREGEPGQSSYDAVVSGVRAMTDRYSFIDKDNIGLNGHSWGGYQTAYLVTRTDMFKAVVSGAPVSNMTSAYGGIRWETGKSRMFQYENTQSRIGGTLWEKTLEFIENSPVFFAPRVNTPVLILHNDKDGSVPWEQGIEYFMALRRLGKPAWLISYKGEGHKTRAWKNRLDYSRRVMAYYDYYLKGADKPSWM